jgi:hypothetical protein
MIRDLLGGVVEEKFYITIVVNRVVVEWIVGF